MPIGWSLLIIFYSWFKIAHWDIDSDLISFMSLDILDVSFSPLFQRWWVLKSKLFAQKSTCSKEILIPASLNYVLMILSSLSTKSWLSWFSMWNIWNTVWIRCWGNCLHLLGFWNFFVFFRFFPPKLVYFWTKSRKKRYGRST